MRRKFARVSLLALLIVAVDLVVPKVSPAEVVFQAFLLCSAAAVMTLKK
jgi:hypothetical protein